MLVKGATDVMYLHPLLIIRGFTTATTTTNGNSNNNQQQQTTTAVAKAAAAIATIKTTSKHNKTKQFAAWNMYR